MKNLYYLKKKNIVNIPKTFIFRIGENMTNFNKTNTNKNEINMQNNYKNVKNKKIMFLKGIVISKGSNYENVTISYIRKNTRRNWKYTMSKNRRKLSIIHSANINCDIETINIGAEVLVKIESYKNSKYTESRIVSVIKHPFVYSETEENITNEVVDTTIDSNSELILNNYINSIFLNKKNLMATFIKKYKETYVNKYGHEFVENFNYDNYDIYYDIAAKDFEIIDYNETDLDNFDLDYNIDCKQYFNINNFNNECNQYYKDYEMDYFKKFNKEFARDFSNMDFNKFDYNKINTSCLNLDDLNFELDCLLYNSNYYENFDYEFNRDFNDEFYRDFGRDSDMDLYTNLNTDLNNDYKRDYKKYS